MNYSLFGAITIALVTACCSAGEAVKSPRQTESNDNNGLDLLKNYDRDLWSGPDGWDQQQWSWKRKLRWDKACDYVADIETYPLQNNTQLVQVMCVPGAYQPTYYLFTYDAATKTAKQLLLGDTANTDNSKEVVGNISFTVENLRLAIHSLSRGVGDCGSYRVYQMADAVTPPRLIEKREQACSESPLPENPPAELFDPKRWPLVK
ncbi:DUF1176 domain-containing protein [Agarilytica rhodophyticola]|uniref:DUF1176 domain-containing protein n=1 Tax=Agarilytica rhodophyticola TaxID=1737490 RepID=UPI000B348F6B|nr:DUF1176 domain-containing protein [Agarilytica rhodophyticola]